MRAVARIALASMLLGGGAAQAAPACGLYQYRAIVTDVPDGHTVIADIDLGFFVWRHKERLWLQGIEAPRVEGAESESGIKARDALRDRVEGKELVICTSPAQGGLDAGSDNYGRFLAKIYLGDELINDWMVSQGLARVDDGTTR